MIAHHVVSALFFALLPQLPVEPPTVQDTAPLTKQDDPTTKPNKPLLPKGLRERVVDPFADLKPGALPTGTTPSARERFERLIPRNAMGAALDKPLTAFDLDFEIVSRGTRQQHNQGNVKVRFQEPAFVAFSVGKDKQMGYGPPGYWQAFPDGTRLLNGREYDSDRRRIGEVRSVAKNFLSLADPRRLRITRVEVPSAAPTLVPPGLTEELKDLEWLVIESPDFDLAVSIEDGASMTVSTNRVPRLFRATLGLKGLEVRHALVQELTLREPQDPAAATERSSENKAEDKAEAVQAPKAKAPTSKVLLQTSMWVAFKKPITVGPASLPSNVFVYYPEAGRPSIQFGLKPRDEMYLLKGRLNPEMAPEVFNPPGL